MHCVRRHMRGPGSDQREEAPDERPDELGPVDSRQRGARPRPIENWFDRMLVGVLVLLAFAVVFLFVATDRATNRRHELASDPS